MDSAVLFPCSCYNVDVRLNVAQEVPWHWHEEIEAIAIVEGRGLVLADGDTWLLEEGDGAFINTNTLHSVQLLDGGVCRLHSLVFSAELLAGMPGTVFEQRYLRPVLCSPVRAFPLRQNIAWQQQAVSTLEGAYRAFAAESFGWELLVRAQTGIRGKTLIFNLPGSPKAARENLEAVLPALTHGLEMLSGRPADCAAGGGVPERPKTEKT